MDQGMKHTTDPAVSCHQEYVDAIFVFDIIVKSCFCIIMVFALLYRWKQIHSLARQNTLEYSQVFYIRQILVIFESLCYVIYIIEAYTVTNEAYWLLCKKTSSYSLIWIVPIFINSFQMYILRLQYIRRVPIMWMHKVFWTSGLLINAIIFILFFLQEEPLELKIVPLIKLCDLDILTIMSFFFYRQDIMEFEDQNCWQMTLPEIRPVDIRSNYNRHQKNRIYHSSFIDNVDGQNGLKNSKMVQLMTLQVAQTIRIMENNITLQIKVKIPNKESVELTKSIMDFILLQKNVIKEIERECDEDQMTLSLKNINSIKFNLEDKLSGLSSPASFNENIKVIDQFMQKQVKFLEFYTTNFLNFLEIDQEDKQMYQEERQKYNMYIIEEEKQLSDSYNTNSSPIMNSRQSKGDIELQKSTTSQKLAPKGNSMIEEVTIFETGGTGKSMKMVAQSLRPNRLSGDEEMEKRNRSSVSKASSNLHQVLSGNQSGLNLQLQTIDDHKVEKPEEDEAQIYQYFKVNAVSVQVKSDHQVYVFSIQILDDSHNRIWDISKRYNEFQDFHDSLAKEFKSQQITLPQIPSQMEKDPEVRKEKFQQFLNIILNENEYYCENLWKFINLNSKEFQSFLSRDPSQDSRIDLYRATRMGSLLIMQQQDENYDNSVPSSGSSAEFKHRKKKGGTYTLYKFLIETKIKLGTQNKYEKISEITQRFSEFVELHNNLKYRFENVKNQNVVIPSIPPKFDTFGTKTTWLIRQVELEKYLNLLFKVPGVGQSFAFRKFIEYSQQPIGGSSVQSKDVFIHTIASSSLQSPNSGGIRDAEADGKVNSFQIEGLSSGLNQNSKYFQKVSPPQVSNKSDQYYEY